VRKVDGDRAATAAYEEELKLKELARNENTEKGFSGEDSKGNMIDIESNVQRAKHETNVAP
jgi:hypothetical protein